jgi:membrane protein implicated in regulation of membrane protease activity
MVSAWHLWIIVAILLFITEVFATGFLLASLGIGCIFSAFAAAVGFGLKGQLLGFIVGTVIAFFGVRPFFLKYCYRGSSDVRTNVDALIGQTGRVTETISHELNTGRVFAGGDDWKAVAVDGGIVEKGAKVVVEKVEGTKLFVKPL